MGNPEFWAIGQDRDGFYIADETGEDMIPKFRYCRFEDAREGLRAIVLRELAAQGENPIRTTHVYPPIPTRSHDWSAVRDDYEPGALIGWGTTEADAIADLLQLEAECDR